MKATMNTPDLGSVMRYNEKVKKRLVELHGKQIPYSEIFDESFMSKCSKFSSIIDLLKAGGFSVKSIEELNSIPKEKLDKYISESTPYKSWPDMSNAAMLAYAERTA